MMVARSAVARKMVARRALATLMVAKNFALSLTCTAAVEMVGLGVTPHMRPGGVITKKYITKKTLVVADYE